MGLVTGAGAAAVIDRAVGGDLLGGQAAVVLPLIALLIAVVGLLAAVGPAMRGLRIQTSETLKADG